jgi:hypothetical protein
MIIYRKKRGNKMMYDIFDDQKTLNLWAKKMLDDQAMERALETQAELDSDHMRDMGES